MNPLPFQHQIKELRSFSRLHDFSFKGLFIFDQIWSQCNVWSMETDVEFYKNAKKETELENSLKFLVHVMGHLM